MFGPGEVGCFRQVVALYSEHFRQVSLYIKCFDQGRLAALDRWLHYTVTTINKFHCSSNIGGGGGCLSVWMCVRTSSHSRGALPVSVWLETRPLPCGSPVLGQ